MKRGGWFLVGAGALGLLVGLVVGTADSHHTNARYLLWKQTGLGYADPLEGLRFFNVDTEFRRSLIGKTPAELQRWFPKLRSPTEANAYQQHYHSFTDARAFSWIGSSWWGVEWKDGRAADFHLVKG